jgi:hypothetical protein
LFDIENDPAESRNLINVPELQDIANEMRQKVIDFRQKTEDPWLEQSFQEGETQPFFHLIAVSNQWSVVRVVVFTIG